MELVITSENGARHNELKQGKLMSEHIDPFAGEQDDMPVAPENNDEQTRHQVAALLNRLQRIRKSHIHVWNMIISSYIQI